MQPRRPSTGSKKQRPQIHRTQEENQYVSMDISSQEEDSSSEVESVYSIGEMFSEPILDDIGISLKRSEILASCEDVNPVRKSSLKIDSGTSFQRSELQTICEDIKPTRMSFSKVDNGMLSKLPDTVSSCEDIKPARRFLSKLDFGRSGEHILGPGFSNSKLDPSKKKELYARSAATLIERSRTSMLVINKVSLEKKLQHNRSMKTTKRMTSELFANSVVGFVPRGQLVNMVHFIGDIESTKCETFEAAVLFCDISGFTVLTETLARHEDMSSGAEQLTRILSTFFSKLFAVLDAYGGDVVKFAGDAIMVLFKNEELEIAQVALSAVRCALQVQNDFSCWKTEIGTTLSVHNGLGVGTVNLMYVGGVLNRWEMLFAGPPVLQIATATGDAASGETAISPEMELLLRGDLIQTQKIPQSKNYIVKSVHIHSKLPLIKANTAFMKNIPGRALEQVKKFVPGAVLSRLVASQGTSQINELRQLTVVFFNFPDLIISSSEQQPLVQELIEAIQSCLYYFEGSLNKFLVDDKGCTFLGAFGLPPLSHEDDAIRALQCAVAAHSIVWELGHRCSIGVASGQVFCGILGSDARYEYAIMGTVVNLAARLMQAANPKGEILNDENTFMLSQRWLNPRKLRCTKLPCIRVKGIADKVTIYRPQEVDCAEDWQSIYLENPEETIVMGRNPEKVLISKCLDQLSDESQSQAKCIWIEGDAGTGKTELMKTIVRDPRIFTKHLILLGSAEATESLTPFYIFRSVFLQLFHRSTQNAEESSEVEDIEKHLNRVLLEINPENEQLQSLFNIVLPIDAAISPRAFKLKNEDKMNLTETLLLHVLQHFAKKRSLVIVLEDCHEMDTMSWKLLYRLLSESTHILVIASSRIIDVDVSGSGDSSKKKFLKYRTKRYSNSTLYKPFIKSFHGIIALNGTVHILLDELSVTTMSAIICHRLAIKSVPPLVVEMLELLAKGNPFIALELVNHMKDQEYIIISKDGDCFAGSDIRSIEDIDFPENVKGLITGRVDMLSANVQLVLRIASAMGKSFDLESLRSLTDNLKKDGQTDAWSLELSLLKLQESGFIAFEGMNPMTGVEEYRFEMDLVRDIAYSRMPFEFRRVVHREIAKMIQVGNISNDTQTLTLLAHHFKRSGDVAECLRYYAKAGAQANKAHSFEEAIELYLKLLDYYLVEVTKQYRKRQDVEVEVLPQRKGSKKQDGEKKSLLSISLAVNALMVGLSQQAKSEEKEDYSFLHEFNEVQLANCYYNMAYAFLSLGALGKAEMFAVKSLRILDTQPFPTKLASIQYRILQESISLYVLSRDYNETKDSQPQSDSIDSIHEEDLDFLEREDVDEEEEKKAFNPEELRTRRRCRRRVKLTQLKQKWMKQVPIEEDAESSSSLMKSELYSMMGTIKYFGGDDEAQTYAVLRSLNFALRHGKPTPQLARCFATACLAARRFEAVAKGEKFARMAVNISKHRMDKSAGLHVNILVSLFYVQVGRLKLADVRLVEATLIATKLGDLRRLEETANMRGIIAWAQGRFDQSKVFFQKAFESAVVRSDTHMAARLSVGRAVCAIALTKTRPNEGYLGITSLMTHLQEYSSNDPMLKLAYNVLHTCLETLEACHTRKLSKSCLINITQVTKIMEEIKCPTQPLLYPVYAHVVESLFMLYSMSKANRKIKKRIFELIKSALTSFRVLAFRFEFAKPRFLICFGIFQHLHCDSENAKKTWHSASSLSSSIGMEHEIVVANMWITHQENDSEYCSLQLEDSLNRYSQRGSAWMRLLFDIIIVA